MNRLGDLILEQALGAGLRAIDLGAETLDIPELERFARGRKDLVVLDAEVIGSLYQFLGSEARACGTRQDLS